MVPTSWKKMRRGFYQINWQRSAFRAKKNQPKLQLVEFIKNSSEKTIKDVWISKEKPHLNSQILF